MAAVQELKLALRADGTPVVAFRFQQGSAPWRGRAEVLVLGAPPRAAASPAPAPAPTAAPTGANGKPNCRPCKSYAFGQDAKTLVVRQDSADKCWSLSGSGRAEPG